MDQCGAVAWADHALSGFRATSSVSGTVGNASLNWVVVGGESGPSARPCDISNIRSIVRQCKSANVACFVKQLGAEPVDWRHDVPEAPPYEFHFDDRKGGDINEWPEDLRIRQFPPTHKRRPQHDKAECI
jgi:hypothetical protein